MREPELSTVAESITATLAILSPAEKRIARALLADYPSAGLGTTASLAKAANSSSATVMRFCVRLGFDSFMEMQDQLRSELTMRTASPFARAEEETARSGEPSGFAAGGADRARLITQTFNRAPQSEVEHLIRLLTRTSNRVVVAGGHYSGLVGRLTQLQLAKVRPGVVFLEDPQGRDMPYVADLRRQDLLLVFDVRRYQEPLFHAAGMAKKHSASVALITDQWLSPIAGIADIVLQADVDVTFFDSQVGCLALAEAVVHQAATRIDGAVDRLRDLEALRQGEGA